jgi:hypothetical protein
LALSTASDADNELLLMRGRLFVKRVAIIWFIESLFGPVRKRPNWALLMALAGITMALLMLMLRWAG